MLLPWTLNGELSSVPRGSFAIVNASLPLRPPELAIVSFHVRDPWVSSGGGLVPRSLRLSVVVYVPSRLLGAWAAADAECGRVVLLEPLEPQAAMSSASALGTTQAW